MPNLNTLLNKSKGMPTDNQLRNQGDEARDARNWAGATDAYQRYLEAVPGDGGIWVQYGHSLKEQGKLEEAVTAYEKGAGLQVGDADVRLHLAHLLKRLDRPRQAAAAFRTAMELTPTPEILSELKSLGYESGAQVSVDRQSGKAVKHGRYIELKDLFQYLSLHTTVTGITRVTLGLLHHILEEMDEERAASYQFVHMYGDAEGLLQLPKQQVRRIVRMAMSATPDLSLMQNMIGELRQRSPFARLKAGDLYMIVGAFWEFEANPAWLGGMKQRGVIIGAYIYDLIPITHAHYCMAALTNAFTAAFADTSRLLDFSLTISEFVAHQVKDYVKLHGIEPFPTKAVPLAHELRFESELMAEESEGSTVLDVLDGRRFVLCVCTIEARKNHIYLFYIWQRMIDAGISVPDLVFVGRQGWRVQDLFGQIEASSNLGGHLHIMHGLSDADLTTLYDHCMFTVFPSFVEGWGLPVGESLAHGKVCVASSSTSIPEVGGDFAAYVDPFNLESGYQEIRRLVTDPDHLAQLETRIRNGFRARGWKDVGKDFFAGLDEVLDQRKRQPERPLYAPDLSSGSLLNAADLTNVGARGVGYVRNPQRLVLAEGWRSAEASGTWMLDSVAKLRFHTDIGPGRPVTILLQIGTSPWVNQTNRLRIRVANAESVSDFDDRGGYSKPMEPDRRFLARITGASDDAGYVSVQLKIDGAIRTSDKQAIAVGLRLFAVGYVASDDYLARISLLEEVILQPG